MKVFQKVHSIDLYLLEAGITLNVHANQTMHSLILLVITEKPQN